MARPRKFDEQTVLSGAMLVFWQKGYAATSTEDLEQATLIRRGSLYNAYTDKRTLFFKALEHYGHKEITEVVSIMTSAKSLVTGYQQVLDKAIAPQGDVSFVMPPVSWAGKISLSLKK